MSVPDTLFHRLLRSEWTQLALPVQRMHGPGVSVLARGRADVSGADNFPARCLRRLLDLPAPGIGQLVEVTIERQGTRETWTRRFEHRQMRSVLALDGATGQLGERLGPVTLHFELRRDGTDIDWALRGAKVLGVALPRALLGKVLSRSGSRDNRYAFDIDARLPWLGQLVAYRGWLEIVDEP